jgi:hypothetical protein
MTEGIGDERKASAFTSFSVRFSHDGPVFAEGEWVMGVER